MCELSKYYSYSSMGALLLLVCPYAQINGYIFSSSLHVSVTIIQYIALHPHKQHRVFNLCSLFVLSNEWSVVNVAFIFVGFRLEARTVSVPH